MSESNPTPLTNSDSSWRRDLAFDAICEKFEAACRAGQTPCIKEYLNSVTESLRPQLEIELLAVLRHVSGPTSETSTVMHGVGGTVGTATNLGSAGQPRDSGVRFQILRQHAKGGLGVVYVAHDREVNRQVALKEIQMHRADDVEGRARFLREAEITGGLEHPGIVPIYGLGHYADGRPYYAMRFIQGDSLQDAIKSLHADKTRDAAQRDLALKQLLRRFIDVCNAIEYAHSKGVLHRDLKPANVMLGKFGETLVVDWGLAKATGKLTGDAIHSTSEAPIQPAAVVPDGDPTMMGSAIGTPAYMPPEQAAGRLDLLSAASDVYSLGATLYHVLTGRPPIIGNTALAILADVSTGTFPRPRSIDSKIDAGIEAICLKAMAKEPADRYASAALLRKDVESWIADAPVSAWPDPVVVRVRRWINQHRVLAATGFASAVMGLIFFGVLTVVTQSANEKLGKLAQDETKARADADVQKVAAQEARKATEEALVAAKRQLRRFEAMQYIDQIAAAQKAMNEFDYVASRDMLARTFEDLRHIEYDFLAGELNRRRPRELSGSKGSIARLVLSADGKQLYGGGGTIDGGEITIWDTATGKVTRNFESPQENVNCLVLSTDGVLLVSGGMDNAISVWNLPLGEQANKKTLLGHTAPVNAVALSADSKRLFSGSFDGSIKVWNVANGEELRTLQSGVVFSLALSADGKQLFSGGREVDQGIEIVAKGDEIKVWNVEMGKVRLTLRGHADQIFSLVPSRDGNRLYSGSRDATIKIWDLQSGKEIKTLHGHTGQVSALALSTDGKWLFSGSRDRAVVVWDVHLEKEVARFRGHDHEIYGLALSADNKRLFSGGGEGELREWNLALEDNANVLRGHDGEVTSLVLSANRKGLLSGSTDRTIKVWDLDTGKVLKTLRGHEQPILSLALSSDDERLFSGGGSLPDFGSGEIKVWNLRKNEKPLTLGGPSFPVLGLAFDGRRLFTGGKDLKDGEINLWDVDTERKTASFRGHDHFVSRMALSGDGKRLCSASLKTLKVWDVAEGKELFTRHSSRFIHSLLLSVDGQRLCWSEEGGAIHVVHLERKEAPLLLQGHDGDAISLAWTADGERLVSGGSDGTVRIWRLDVEKETLILRGHTGPVLSLVLSTDNERLVSGSSDNTIRVWRMGPGPRRSK